MRTSARVWGGAAMGVLSWFHLCGLAEEVAQWAPGEVGEWTVGTNLWQGADGTPLAPPGYPGSAHAVGIAGGGVYVASQNVTVAELSLTEESVLCVTNGRTLTVTAAANYEAVDRIVGAVRVPYGTVNLLHTGTGVVCGLSFELGTNALSGFLDLGGVWGATNNLTPDFGALDLVTINLRRGGLRVDTGTVAMRNQCFVQNRGQELTLRGDWTNPDGTTTLWLNGTGAGTLDVAGSLFFGRCALHATVDTNGVSLLRIGGDAVLTNVTLTVGATTALTSLGAGYDLIRVPAARSILTNGLAVTAAPTGGILCGVMLDYDRGGYNYLRLVPTGFLPTVVLTAPADESFFTAVTNLTLQANATARNGTVSKVEFFASGAKIGETTTAPHQATWTNVYAGCYEVKASVTDSNGNRGESPSIIINVQGPSVSGKRVFITGGAVITYDPACAAQ